MQKNLQQLDLFGFPSEMPVMQSARRSKSSPAPAIALPEEPRPVTEPEVPVVFANENIVIKIKAKAPVQKETSSSVTRQAGKRGRKSFKEIDTEVDLVEVPDEEVLKQKLYYSISEVAGWFKVNTSLLRYWENEFDVLQPRKTRKGDRLFRVEDIKNLQLIYYLLRQRKFSIEGARNYLKVNKKKVDTQTQLVQSLTKFRSFLLELKATL